MKSLNQRDLEEITRRRRRGSITGSAIEITVKLSQADINGATSEAGWLIAGELVDVGISKIPGVSNKNAETIRENLSEHILKNNANVKLIGIERAVKNNSDE